MLQLIQTYIDDSFFHLEVNLDLFSFKEKCPHYNMANSQKKLHAKYRKKGEKLFFCTIYRDELLCSMAHHSNLSSTTTIIVKKYKSQNIHTSWNIKVSRSCARTHKGWARELTAHEGTQRALRAQVIVPVDWFSCYVNRQYWYRDHYKWRIQS